MGERRVLAVDLGKTGCRAALTGGGAGEGVGAPGLAAAGGAAAAEAAILAVARPLLQAVGVARVDAVAVGAAGALAAPAAARALAERLCAVLADEAVVGSDAVFWHAGALGGAAGVVLAAGTGAVAVGLGADGVMRRADGCGPWLGDEGSGAWIGRHGLIAAVRAADGRGPGTVLLAAAEAAFGPIGGVPALVEGAAEPARLLAGFAPAVAAAADGGDPEAAGVMARAGAALAAAALAVGRVGPVVVAGGLVGLGAALMQPLLAALAGSGRVVQAAMGDALEGAVLLAARRDLPHEALVVRASGTAGPAAVEGSQTEGVRAGLEDLDLWPTEDVVRLLLGAERAAQGALERAAPHLAAAVAAVAARMRAGGRLFYLGAGTPGRLAVLDAAELAPTYSAPPGLVVALLAGGPGAMVNAAEGAEDDGAAAVAALAANGIAAGDCVVGIAASGRTPFVVAGLAHARGLGALTVAIVNNPGSPAAAAADLAVEILTGAEVVAGSTRMTAGTVQKIALNTLSTAVMIALGKTYGARMVDVRASNAKLRRRALRMVCDITGVDEDTAAAALAAAGGRVKPAVVALLAGVDAAAAARLLEGAGGRVRDAVAGALPGPAIRE